jgi:hypothetical protein
MSAQSMRWIGRSELITWRGGAPLRIELPSYVQIAKQRGTISRIHPHRKSI